MTIAKLGQTRRMLLKSFENLTDEQFDQKPSAEKWSISQDSNIYKQFSMRLMKKSLLKNQ